MLVERLSQSCSHRLIFDCMFELECLLTGTSNMEFMHYIESFFHGPYNMFLDSHGHEEMQDVAELFLEANRKV